MVKVKSGSSDAELLHQNNCWESFCGGALQLPSVHLRLEGTNLLPFSFNHLHSLIDKPDDEILKAVACNVIAKNGAHCS